MPTDRLSGPGDVDSSIFNSYHGPVILIVEDHRAVRQALRELMHVAFGAISVLEATNVGDALQAVRSCRVDIVLMDIRLPGVDGVSGARQVLECSAHSAIVMVSNLDDSFHRHAATRAGAKAFVSKRAIGKELVPAIEALLAAHRAEPDTGEEPAELIDASRRHSGTHAVPPAWRA